MTKRILAYIFLLSLLPMSYGQNVLMNYFNINTEGADIVLEWEVQSENNVSEYRLFRKINNEPDYSYVSTVTANGSLRYQYLDGNIFKNAGRVIHYELQVVVGNKIQTFNVSVSHNPTSIQRTWGSIKSMFR
jgi:hypothetical protein